jgi:hypothetical protein
MGGSKVGRGLKDWFQPFALPSKHRHKNPSFTRHGFSCRHAQHYPKKGWELVLRGAHSPLFYNAWYLLLPCLASSQKGMRLPVNCQFFHENHWFLLVLERTRTNGSLILNFFKEPAPAGLWFWNALKDWNQRFFENSNNFTMGLVLV